MQGVVVADESEFVVFLLVILCSLNILWVVCWRHKARVLRCSTMDTRGLFVQYALSYLEVYILCPACCRSLDVS